MRSLPTVLFEIVELKRTLTMAPKVVLSQNGNVSVALAAEKPQMDVCKFSFNIAMLLTVISLMALTGVLITMSLNPMEDKLAQTPSALPLVSRGQWGGRPSFHNTAALRHPTEMVLISHTATHFCTTVAKCSALVQTIQDYHVGHLGHPDIGYNFLIGGDGNIYVGRGWDIVNFHMDGCIGISFIGNYVYDELSDKMVTAAEQLLDEGMVLGKLSMNYTLVAHNYTKATLSPGRNVYKIIKNWPHFSTEIEK